MELRAGVAYSSKNAQSGRYPDVPQGTNEDNKALITWHEVVDRRPLLARAHRRAPGEVTAGLVQTGSNTVQDHTGIKVNAKAGFEYAGAYASIETEVSYSLNVTTYHSTPYSQSTTEKASFTSEFKNGEKAVTCWYRDNVFVLTRLNGTDVVGWTTREPDTQVFDAWPKNVLTKKS